MENGEVMVVDNSTPSLNNQFDIVDVGAAKEFMDNYQELVKALLDDTDYQDIQTNQGIKKSKKKSAWRKLATAFNISDDVVEKEITYDECHRIISARFEVRATLPNGRHGIGTGGASIYDKIKRTDEKEPTPFELRQRFTNAEHDIISTAHTRAKSRAISDLIGAGEVSAEELSGAGVGKPRTPVKPKPSNGKPKSMKPKAPKTPAPPKEDKEAIEVEIVHDEPEPESKTENPAIKHAVDELTANGATVNNNTIRDKLLDFMDMGKISTDEYKEAKALLE